MQEPEAKPKANLSDIGTRYEHLCDYRDNLEICVNLLKERLVTASYPGSDEKQRFAKFTVALEVINSTIEAFAGFRDSQMEYRLYQQISSIPAIEEIPSTRGTPLK